MTNKPNPGSPEAVKQGCKCPILDNANGRGAYGSSGDDAVFWIAESCPLHANREPLDEMTRIAQEAGLYDE